MDKKALFNRIYANLPLASREEIAVVVDNKPMTWNVIWIEVENNTEKGKKALEILENLGLLQTK